MKNLMVLFLVTALSINASGQGREVSLSFSTYRVDFERYGLSSDEPGEWRDISNLCNIGLGYYIPVFAPQPNFGLGINATITGGARYASSSNHEIYGDLGLPVTATLRYGAGSTREAYSPIGVGLGAGFRLNAAVVPDGDPFYIQEDPVVLIMLKPYMFIELVLDYQKRNKSFLDNIKIQFAIQPSHTKSGFSPDMESNITGKMSYYSISFIKFNAIN